MDTIIELLKKLFAWIGEKKRRIIIVAILCIALCVALFIGCKSVKVDSAHLSGLEILR